MIDDRKLQQLRNEGHDDVADALLQLMGYVKAASEVIRGLEAERGAAYFDAASLRDRLAGVEAELRRYQMAAEADRADDRHKEVKRLTAERDELAKRWQALEALLLKPSVLIARATGYGDCCDSLVSQDEGVWHTAKGEFPTLAEALASVTE